MCIILTIFVIGSFRVVFSEWIEISQSIGSSNEMSSNRSLMINNIEKAPKFDYSTYKDFFSIIEPDIDFVRDVQPIKSSHHSFVDNITAANKLNQKDLHVFMVGSTQFHDQFRKNHMTMDSSNVSIFSDFSDGHDQIVINPLKVNSIVSKPEIEDKVREKLNEQPTEMEKKKNGNKQRTKEDENRAIFKRVELKPFDFNGVMQFFTNIQQSFSMDAVTGIRDKIKFLENFKDTLLINIEERFKLLWSASGDQVKHEQRVRRSSSSHGMDFPSSETALMTISFLTLAVFLIKLVLQVIHTIKSKHVGLQTMTPSGETPIKIIKTNRNARKLSLSTDDLRAVTEAISSIEKSSKTYT